MVPCTACTVRANLPFWGSGRYRSRSSPWRSSRKTGKKLPRAATTATFCNRPEGLCLGPLYDVLHVKEGTRLYLDALQAVKGGYNIVAYNADDEKDSILYLAQKDDGTFEYSPDKSKVTRFQKRSWMQSQMLYMGPFKIKIVLWGRTGR